MAKITVRDLYKIYGSKPIKALEQVKEGMSKDALLKETGHSIGINRATFHIEEGETFVIMGLSGSGKSTLIRCLNRLIEPTAGDIWIDEENICEYDEQQLYTMRRTKIAMVFQHFALFPHRTVAENVAYGLEIQNVNKDARMEKARTSLDLVGLSGYEDSYPKELSGGMQQRVGLARALATDADILLMDEAFSALDPLIRTEMQDELMGLQETMKKTIVFITHDLDEALKIGDRIAIMKEGAIVQIGTPEDILKNPADDYVTEFIRDVDRTKVLIASAVMKKPNAITTSKDGIHVALRKMCEANISSIFVVNKERTLLGLLTVDAAVKALKSGLTDMTDLLITDIDRTGPDTSLSELLPVATQAKYPIAVVNENNRLLGIIVRSTVLAGIAGLEVEDV